ncbi:uncharacterized protein LOC111116561 [Crassostrea virginica]
MTCMRTDTIGGNSPYLAVWWKVDLGGVYNIYSVNILFKNYDGYESRQQGRFAGFSLYISNNGDIDNSSLCYKDGPQLPPLNFTTTCITSGRYVIFYNERLDGTTYPKNYQTVTVFTELCEVIVQGCHTSIVYGDNCDERCPTNCKYNTCHIQNGTCFECKPGWMRRTCDIRCADGWYGVDCKQNCSGHCRDNIPCNHVTGQCDGGCAAGWSGELCDTECKNGTFGLNCVNSCSGNCLNDSPCNRQTGHCETGCKLGYTNALCNQHCFPGSFGNECEQKCSGHCLENRTCDRIDGTCNDGCNDGYMGKLCNDFCKEGYYGRNCSRVCPSNCKTCKPTDGTCSCYAGWMGPNCSIGCVWSYGEDCRYPCNKHCVNQTCDRFNGSCLSGCDSGFHGEKCDQEYESTSCFASSLSTVSSGFLGAVVSLCVFVTMAVVIYTIRRRKTCIHCNNRPSSKVSPNAEIENPQTGDSTYQELSIPESEKAYQNLALQ